MSIGTRIKKFREAKGWTQATLGEKCKMADSAIRRYESDRGNPTQKTLQRIADALDISVKALISEEHIIIPGRLSVFVTDDPEKNDYRFDIEAADEAARDYAINLFSTPGFSFERFTPLGRITIALKKLNPDGQQEAVERVEELTEIPKYKK